MYSFIGVQMSFDRGGDADHVLQSQTDQLLKVGVCYKS